VRPVEELGQCRLLLAEPLTDLPLEGAVDPELGRERPARGFQDGELGLHVEGEVAEQLVHPPECEPPSLIEPRIVRTDELHDLERRLAVRVEHGLGELDAIRPAIPLDLALVGVQRDAPDATVVEERSDGRLEPRPDRAPQLGGRPVETEPQVVVGVAVADEEPSVHGT
jgi:hypothetical protein